MMLAAGKLRVVHVSTHVSLRQACDAVTRERVLKVIELAHDACRGWDRKPTIGVAGLNPHASDGGLFGPKSASTSFPRSKPRVRKGLSIEGPQPPDTFFAKAVSGAYDICVRCITTRATSGEDQGFQYDAAKKTWTA
jgi:4-hydroxythreonine-4-phosphate dehydrogenase